MHAIGPYRFTDQDVATTLQVGRPLFDLLERDLPADALATAAPFRRRAEDALDRLAPTDPEAALDVVWAAWRSATEAVRATGALGRPAVGTATGLFLGDGGVPKHRVDAIDVGFDGVVGDRQADRRDHGRPFQALCLWSTDVTDELRALGHPIGPGLAGENVSLTGLPWPRVRPGARLRLGDVLAEVSSYAVPCAKNARWFVDGRFDVVHHDKGPYSRVYATVLEPGRITEGDPVLVEPGS